MKIGVTEPAEIPVKSADDNLIWFNKDCSEGHPEGVHPSHNVGEQRRERCLSAEDLAVPELEETSDESTEPLPHRATSSKAKGVSTPLTRAGVSAHNASTKTTERW